MKTKQTLALLCAVATLTACKSTVSSTPETTSDPAIASDESETAYQWETQGEITVKEEIFFDSGRLYANFESVLRSEEKAAYGTLIEAIRAGDAQCAMSQETFEKISGFAAYSPYYALIHTLEYADGAAQMTYLYDTEALTQRVAAFDARLRILLQESGALSFPDTATPERRALELYRYVASQCTFRFGENESLMDCVLADSYTETAFNVLYAQLLLQAGLPTVLVSDANGRVWVAAELDGDWYHFDPVDEFIADTGFGLRYFGMTDSRRIRDEITAPLTVLVPAYWAANTAPTTPDGEADSPTGDPTEPTTPDGEADSPTGDPTEPTVPDSEADSPTGDPTEPTVPDSGLSDADNDTLPAVDTDDGEPLPFYLFTLICDNPRYDIMDTCNNWAYEEDGNAILLLPGKTSYPL